MNKTSLDIAVNKKIKFHELEAKAPYVGFILYFDGDVWTHNTSLNILKIDEIFFNEARLTFSFSSSDNVRSERNTLFVQFLKEVILFSYNKQVFKFDRRANAHNISRFLARVSRSWFINYKETYSMTITSRTHCGKMNIFLNRRHELMSGVIKLRKDPLSYFHSFDDVATDALFRFIGRSIGFQ